MCYTSMTGFKLFITVKMQSLLSPDPYLFRVESPDGRNISRLSQNFRVLSGLLVILGVSIIPEVRRTFECVGS